MNPLRTVMLATLLLCGTGCSFTSSLWERAGDDHLTLVRLYSAHPSADGQHAALILGYSAGRHTDGERYFEVPLDDQGMPPAAMIYRGKERSLSAIRAALIAHSDSRLQRLELRAFKGPPKSQPPDSHIGGLTPLVSEGWPFLPQADECCVGGFRRSADGTWAPAKPEEIKSPKDWDLVWPDDCTILLFPLTQPRPAGELFASRLTAVVLTPVAIVADIAVTPIAILFLATGHSR